MHHDRIHAHQFHQHHITGKTRLQRLIGHGMTAVFNHDGLALEAFYIGQGLG